MEIENFEIKPNVIRTKDCIYFRESGLALKLKIAEEDTGADRAALLIFLLGSAVIAANLLYKDPLSLWGSIFAFIGLVLLFFWVKSFFSKAKEEFKYSLHLHKTYSMSKKMFETNDYAEVLKHFSELEQTLLRCGY